MKVAVLRARHIPDRDLIPDDVCRQTLIANDTNSAVFQYWEQVSLGEVNFTGSRMFPWIDIEIDGNDPDQLGRDYVYEQARAATENLGHDLGGFDAYVVLFLPKFVILRTASGRKVTKKVEYGGTTIGGKKIAVLRYELSHSLMVHEVGHLLGCGHSYGLANRGDGGKLTNRYGDPFDIMSAATFGNASPTFTFNPVPVPGWPGAGPWRSCGPLPSPGHIDLHHPGLLARHHRLISTTLPDSGVPQRIPLWAYGQAADNQTCLIAVHPPDEEADGVGRYYIEYRDTTGWDSGLDTSGGDVARRSVVVHRLARFDDEVVLWYVGRIVVPQEIDTDIWINGLPLRVRLTYSAPDLDQVVVELSRTNERSVYLERTDVEDILDFTKQRTDTVDTLCGMLSADWGYRRVTTTSTFSVRSYGFGGPGSGSRPGPVATWTVGGKPVAAGTSSVALDVTPSRQVTVEVALDDTGSQLTCVNRPADGQYEVPVIATVSEASGRNATASDPASYAADGTRFGYDHSIQQQLDRCIRDALNKLRVRPNDIYQPPVRGDGPRDTELRVKERLDALINRVRHGRPELAGELQHLVALRYGTLPQGRVD